LNHTRQVKTYSNKRMTVKIWYVDLMRKEYERKPDYIRCHSFESACIAGKFLLKDLKLIKFAIYDIDYEDDENLEHQEDARENTKVIEENNLDEILICSIKK
jgi:hypothetical protein